LYWRQEAVIYEEDRRLPGTCGEDKGLPDTGKRSMRPPGTGMTGGCRPQEDRRLPAIGRVEAASYREDKRLPAIGSTGICLLKEPLS
jgi:hypothetical protein